MKIMIIGYSGSGKSTLAGKISEYYHIPVLYMDTIQFEENWVERDLETKQRMVKEFLDTHDQWVIDGNYTNLYTERREQEADQIIFLNFNRWNCLYRGFKRYLKYRGKSRESMTKGCDEKFDLEFIMWILKDGRTKERAQKHWDKVNRNQDKTIILHNQKEIDRYLQEMADGK